MNESDNNNEMREQKRRLPFWLGILVGVAAMSILLAFVVTIFGTRSIRQQNSVSDNTGSPVESAMNKISLIQTLVDQNFLWDIDDDFMEEKIIDGYITGLDDEYAAYYTAREFEELQESVSGSYAGIGVSVGMNDDGKIEVYQVFSGSPAEEAGMFIGDIITEAGGEKDFENIDDLVAVVRGLPGTYIDLVIDRNKEEIHLTVERRNIVMDRVSYEMLDNNIGYIYIAEFDTVIVEQFENALNELLSDGIESLIIDLRNNPGGDYDTVVKLADRILPEGPIMTVKNKNGTIVTENSDAEHQLDIPMVLLINGGSASASEVFTGAIQDYGMAVIVGEQSYGKGIVQGIFSFTDGSGVKFTTDEYFTPSGDSIHEIGITPDIEVKIPEDAYEDGILSREEDSQLNKAIEILSN